MLSAEYCQSMQSMVHYPMLLLNVIIMNRDGVCTLGYLIAHLVCKHLLGLTAILLSNFYSPLNGEVHI